jgi:hypothetical protein
MAGEWAGKVEKASGRFFEKKLCKKLLIPAGLQRPCHNVGSKVFLFTKNKTLS